MKQKDYLANELGIDPGKMRAVQLEMKALKKQGILIDLNVSGVGMFTKSATWSDIGIQEDADDPRYNLLTTGQKYLIPEERIKALRSIETRMRQWLNKLSYDITGFRPYRWLPVTAYETWVEKFQELTAEMELVKTQILNDYDQYVEELADSFRGVAEASWKSITAQGYEFAIIDGAIYDHDSFIDKVIRSALAKMPAEDKIQKGLRADYVTGVIYGQEEFALDAERAAQIQNRMNIEFEKAKAQQREANATADLLHEQIRHQRRINEMEEDERALKIDAMYAAEAEHARQQLTTLVSPFQEIFEALRAQFAQDAADMLKSIEKNGFVRGKIATKGQGLIEIYDLLAIQDDRELREKLVELKAAIGPIGEKNTETRSTEEVKAVLEKITELTHTAAQDLAAGPSRFAMLEL